MADHGQKTEAPTPQRIRKAREQGRFPSSRDFVFGIQFLAWVVLLNSASLWFPALAASFRKALLLAFQNRNSVDPALLLGEAAWPSRAVALVAAGAAIAALGMLAHLGATGFGFAPAKAAPDLQRLNPVQNLRELPRRNRDSLLAAVLLLPLLLAALWWVVASRWNEFLRLPLLPLEQGAAVVGSAVGGLLWKGALILLAWGAADLFRQRRRYFADLRMSRQEVREEHRQSEGSPEVKARIRRLRRELLRRRMMAEVPKATAVIVNPTHFAVALRYDQKSMPAPKVVAKGKNWLALRIREKALEHRVPVVENPPLARALYEQVEVGQEIPVGLYRAVAEVLAYVYRLMHGSPAQPPNGGNS
ncbi:MAG: EscU/YscU/HrcU family type III secretion system export apparatus switch protein [Bryobacteraceae bacterium]|jgi:flagellar biosynthetic protein FlhB